MPKKPVLPNPFGPQKGGLAITPGYNNNLPVNPPSQPQPTYPNQPMPPKLNQILNPYKRTRRG
jgi:hypothetical protein